MGTGSKDLIFNQTPNTSRVKLGSQTAGAKLRSQKENSPDPHLRPQNQYLVVKEVLVHRQPGGRLRSSHPSKKA